MCTLKHYHAMFYLYTCYDAYTNMCHMNFVIDLVHLGVSVAQWQGIGAWNPKV